MAENKIVRVGVGVFVWRDGRFIMGQRLGSHGANTWSVPGGHLEFGESWEDCAIREVKEETGMTVDKVRLVALTNDIFEKDNKHYITIWVDCDWMKNEPEITEPDKWINQEWRTFKTLPSPLFEPCWQNLRLVKPELFS
jgi:8-oxo-dGTP diphosphatase